MFDAVRPVCPDCGGSRVHHSRPRSFVERVRRNLTRKAPFRCHSCGWRGWLDDTTDPTPPEGAQPVQRDLTEAELERLEVGGAEGEAK